jgi:hypothetical protein
VRRILVFALVHDLLRAGDQRPSFAVSVDQLGVVNRRRPPPCRDDRQQAAPGERIERLRAGQLEQRRHHVHRHDGGYR